MDLVKGHRYRIIYKSDAQRTLRYAILDYLDEGEGSYEKGSYFFSARPLAGTQEMPKHWVHSIEEVAKNTALTIGRKI